MNDIDMQTLAPYEIEYLFLNLRAKSVNNVIELKITDDEDNNEYEISINLDDIKIKEQERTNIVELSDTVSLIMKDPNYSTVKKFDKKTDDQKMNSILIECIDQILVGDDVILMKDHTKKEQEEFINSLSSKNMRSIEDYFYLMPKLSHEISYTREDGTEVTKTLEGMQSFFT